MAEETGSGIWSGSVTQSNTLDEIRNFKGLTSEPNERVLAMRESCLGVIAMGSHFAGARD